MHTAALIVAAGISSRMGQFKPMLSIGSISIAQRVVATLAQAGIERIVMVTGCNAPMLERHLSGNGVIFLRNPQYASTEMFDSAKIGLSYLHSRCDRVLFTPVDVPLFTARTVRTLLASAGSLVCPQYQGRQGHPILISAQLIGQILADTAGGGLRRTLERCCQSIVPVAVDDPGILLDVDTPQDYSALLEYHNAQLVRPVIQVSLCREKPFFDSQTAMLLMLIGETNSVRAAGQRMQLSYSSCWNLIRTLESQLGCSLVVRNQGGPGGGASVLTDRGRLLLDRYSAYTQRLKAMGSKLFAEYFDDLLV